MQTVLVFLWIYLAMAAMAVWEAAVEGRNAWDKGKLGWKLRVGRYTVATVYHVFVAWVMIPLLLTLPLVVSGWDLRLFGIILSAYASGLVLEDFLWYVVNPVVKLREFWTEFSDYYPWLRVGGRKIIPWGYLTGAGVAVASWLFLWR